MHVYDGFIAQKRDFYTYAHKRLDMLKKWKSERLASATSTNVLDIIVHQLYIRQLMWADRKLLQLASSAAGGSLYFKRLR